MTRALTVSERSPEAPFAAVEVQVTQAQGAVVAGLVAENGDHLLVSYDAGRRRLSIEVRTRGRTRVLRRRTVRLTVPFTLGFALCENQVTALAKVTDQEETGQGVTDQRETNQWEPLLTERRKVAARVDMRDPQVLARYTYAWGARDGVAALGAVRAGLFGMAGLRDPQLVQHSDGRAYILDGKAYLTFACAGLGFFQQAHWGVFTLDLTDPTRLEQVAQLFSHRDGLLLGDHAGQLVRDDDNDCWLVAVSSWGGFDGKGVHVRHCSTADDLLTGVHLLRTERMVLPTQMSAWDPGMTRIDGRWHMSFVESPSQGPFDFHPALAVAQPGGAWTEGLELVGADQGMRRCEGPLLTRIDDAWWVLASDAASRSYPVYDLAMQQVGRLAAPYLTNIPHPTLVPTSGGGHLMVTFDGTQRGRSVMGYGGHGDVVVMEGQTRNVG